LTLEIIKAQEEIINSKEQTILVTARPGRGKTTVALLTASRIIKDGEIAPSQTILFLTFSKNAVYQIEQASRSDLILDKEFKGRVWISTYHAFMWWVLTTFGRFHNLPADLDVMRETKGKAARNSATLVNVDESEISFYLAKNYSAIAYDDFAPLTLSMLNNSQVLRKTIQDRFPVVIVDEFQDTNQEQWQLIKLLSENSRLICFADPNQMIFRWRGASSDRLNQLIVERNAKKCLLQNKCKRTDDHNLLDFAEAILDNNIGSESEQTIWKKRFLVSYPGHNALGYYLKEQIRSFYIDFQKRKSDRQSPSIAIAAYSNNTAKAIQDALAKSTQKAPKTYHCNLLEGQVDDAIDELLLHLAAWISGGVTNQLLQAMKLVGGFLIPDITKANNSLSTLLSPEKLLSKEIQPYSRKESILVCSTGYYWNVV
jgi:DNA helicase II / ATP-dependent DNA helicase PcrA